MDGAHPRLRACILPSWPRRQGFFCPRAREGTHLTPAFAHPVAALLTIHDPRSALVLAPGHHRAVSGCRVPREVALGERTPLVHRSLAEDVRTALHDVPSVHGDYLPLRAFRAAVAFGGRPGPPGRHFPRTLRRRRRPFFGFAVPVEIPPSSD